MTRWYFNIPSNHVEKYSLHAAVYLPLPFEKVISAVSNVTLPSTLIYCSLWQVRVYMPLCVTDSKYTMYSIWCICKLPDKYYFQCYHLCNFFHFCFVFNIKSGFISTFMVYYILLLFVSLHVCLMKRNLTKMCVLYIIKPTFLMVKQVTYQNSIDKLPSTFIYYPSSWH